MASVRGGNNDEAGSRVPNGVVKSEPVNVEYDDNVKSEPVNVEYNDDSVMAACNDSVLASRSLEGNPGDDVQFAPDKHGDTTECSSSFGDSGWQSDDDNESDAGVMEVDSPFFTRTNVGGASATATSHIVRKKNVTADWRNFIAPERWRCQWLELRMKDLLSQVSKYDKELALINHEKHLQLEMIKADSSKSESSQLDLSSYERNAMNKRKRKRHEDDADTSLYIKKHQIFSYYNHENRKSRTDNEKGGVGNEFLVIDDFDNLDVEDTKSSIISNDTLLESQGDDDLLAQYSLREILSEIECIQSRISNLQSHLSEVHNKIDHTQMSRKKKGLHGLHSKKKVDCPFRADEDGTAVEILFGVNNSLIDPHIESICTETADDVLIDNEAAIEEEFWQFERVKRTNEIRPEPIKYTIDAQIVNLVNKKGPKAKKHGRSWKTKSKGKTRKAKRHA